MDRGTTARRSDMQIEEETLRMGMPLGILCKAAAACTRSLPRLASNSSNQSILVGVAAIFMLTAAASGCRESPARPINHSPVIQSLTAYPADIGPTDSVVVTCVAQDADGDTVFHDWQVHLGLNIKGMPPNYPFKNSQLGSSETFYLNYQPSQPDSVWIYCLVRDGRGGGAGAIVVVTVHP